VQARVLLGTIRVESKTIKPLVDVARLLIKWIIFLSIKFTNNIITVGGYKILVFEPLGKHKKI